MSPTAVFRADDAFGSRPEVKPGDIALNDTTLQTSEFAVPTYSANDMHRDQIRSSFSWFQGRHDIKAGYEYVNAARISRIWCTSGLRANFANGVPTSVNTYLVQVTNSETTYGADIDELFRFRADDHGFFIQDRWTPLRRLVVNLGLRYETNSTSSRRHAGKIPVVPGQCFDGHRAELPRHVSALQPRVRPDGDGKTALKFAANRYNQPITSVSSNGSSSCTVSDQRSWVMRTTTAFHSSTKLGRPRLRHRGDEFALRGRLGAADFQ